MDERFGLRQFRDSQLVQLGIAGRLLAGIRTADAGQRSSAVVETYGILFMLKVAATSLGLWDVARLASDVQAIVDDIRSHSLALSHDVASLLEAGLTALRTAVAAIAEDGANPQQDPALLERLRTATTHLPLESDVDGESDMAAFAHDSDAQLEECQVALRALRDSEQDESQVHAAFRAVHTFKGNCGMLGLRRLEAVARTCEDVLSELRAKQLAPTRLLCQSFLALVGRIRASITRGEVLSDTAASDKEPWESEQRALAAASQHARRVAGDTRLGALLVRQNLAEAADIDAALALKSQPLGEILVRLNALTSEQLDGALDLQQRLRRGEASLTPSATAGAAPPRTPERTRMVQVQSHRLEELSACVERLLEAAQPASVARDPEAIERLVNELRDTAERLRLVPLEALFGKLRDMAQQAGGKQDKRVDFHVDGPSLEVDPELARALSDSLLHIVRNAVDHGIEPESDRLRSRKAREGVVQVSVNVSDGRLSVTTRDDGRGLDRQRIVKRARELGIILEHEEPSDEAAYGAIFTPGFSTAAEVNETSGRGVGMDAVRDAVSRVGGAVEVTSRPGQGTTVVLAFPRGIAAVDGRALRLGQRSD